MGRLRPTRSPRARFAIGAALALAVAGTTSFADAAPPDAATRVKAAKLFQEGKVALGAGRISEACPKFEESYRLDAGIGALLALAVCHEAENKTATAWREFNDVIAVSEASGRADRVTIARERVHALEPKLSSLTIDVLPGNRTEHLVITLDQEPLPLERWGKAAYLDPGQHTIEARDTARRPWHMVITVGTADRKSIEIPRLEEEDGSTKDPILDGPGSAPAGGSSRTLGFIVGGAGIVAIGVGAYFGVRALGDRSDAKVLCEKSPCPDPNGVSLNDRAYTEAWVANVAIGVGLVAVGVGTYLAFIRPRSAPPAAQTRAPRITGGGPWLARDGGGGLSVSGRF